MTASADFDFDRPIDRRGGDSVKWNRYADPGVLPMWVADMDFAAPPGVITALEQRVAHGCFGYGDVQPSLVEAVVGHLQREYGWSIEAEWIVWLPGVVTGLNLACRAVDGAVLTAEPVYPAFFSAPVFAGRRLTRVPLLSSGTGWGWDFERLEAAIESDTRLLLLCHPHNPVGRAWTRDELLRLAAICERRDLVVCSDEIHCDLVLEQGRRHLPLALLDESIARRSITLMAPSKTFNIPGLGCAFAVIPAPGLRRAFRHAMHGIVPHVNVLGLAATEAAYREGGGWRAALLDYLRANRERVTAAIEGMPGLRVSPVEATFLAWIDARGLGLEKPAAFFEQAGVGLSDGAEFGSPGWVRLNFACPRRTLDLALERMASVCGVRTA